MIDGLKKLDFVLLIDDDDVVNVLNTLILRQSELIDRIQAVESADSGLETLAECQKKNKWPSIIFVDINMPGINGWEFIERFRESFLSYKQKCIICMLSSSLDPHDKEKADQSDLVDFYISKPLSREAVQTLIQQYNSNKLA